MPKDNPYPGDYAIWAFALAAEALRTMPKVKNETDIVADDDTPQETTEKCGMGYPTSGLSCIRPAGHASPTSICFCLADGAGVYLYQDETVFVDHPDEWPLDIILGKIERHEATAKPNPLGTSRRQAIEAQKARKNARI